MLSWQAASAWWIALISLTQPCLWANTRLPQITNYNFVWWPSTIIAVGSPVWWTSTIIAVGSPVSWPSTIIAVGYPVWWPSTIIAVSCFCSCVIGHKLKNNDYKTEFMVISSRHMQKGHDKLSFHIGSTEITTERTMMDSVINMEAHVTSIC